MLRCMDSARCWKHFFEILFHADVASQFLQMCELHIHAANLPFYQIPKGVLWDLDPVLGRSLKNIELFVMFMKPVWDDFCFVTWFPSTEPLLTGCFLFFAPFSANSRNCCAWKSADSEMLKPPCMAPTIIPRSFESHFFPILAFGLEKQLNLLTTSACFDAFSCCWCTALLNSDHWVYMFLLCILITGFVFQQRVQSEEQPELFIIETPTEDMFLCYSLLWYIFNIVCEPSI